MVWRWNRRNESGYIERGSKEAFGSGQNSKFGAHTRVMSLGS